MTECSTPTQQRRPDPLAVHLGPVGSQLPGGIAQLLAVLDAEGVPGWQMARITTVRRPRDWLSPLLALHGLWWLVRRWPVRNRTIVVAHLSQRGSLLREGGLAVLACLMGFRTSVTVHGSGFARFARRHARLCSVVLARVDLVTVLSEEALEIVERLAPEVRVVRRNNAVPLDKGSRPLLERERRVVFAGEVGLRKGVDTLLAAWEQTQPEDGWTLTIAGPGQPGLTLDVPPSAELIGPVSNQAVQTLLKESQIAVLPSRAETMPIFLLEAMAHGCAVIGSNVGAIGELLWEDSGVLVEPGDVDALSTALALLCRDHPRRQQLGTAARARVRHAYSADSLRQVIASDWAELLARRSC